MKEFEKKFDKKLGKSLKNFAKKFAFIRFRGILLGYQNSDKILLEKHNSKQNLDWEAINMYGCRILLVRILSPFTLQRYPWTLNSYTLGYPDVLNYYTLGYPHVFHHYILRVPSGPKPPNSSSILGRSTAMLYTKRKRRIRNPLRASESDTYNKNFQCFKYCFQNAFISFFYVALSSSFEGFINLRFFLVHSIGVESPKVPGK